jgi:hypothetical protein
MSPETTPNSCTCGSCACESAWQPIETAPRDGSYFLGVFIEDMGRSMAVLAYDTDPAGAEFPWLADDVGAYHMGALTHWRPLPTPPTT